VREFDALSFLFEEHERKPLSKSSIVLFCYIAANGMAPWRQLQRRLHFSSATLSRAFKELENRGLLDVLSIDDDIGASKIEAAGAFKTKALSKLKHEDFPSTSEEECSASKNEALSPSLSYIYKKERENNNSAFKTKALSKLKQKGRGKNERFKNPAVKPSPFSIYDLIARKSV